MKRSRLFTAVAALGAVGTAAVLTSGAASAAPHSAEAAAASKAAPAPTIKVLSKKVYDPGQLAYGHGALYLTEGATSAVEKFTGKGLKKVIQGPKGNDVSGVGVNAQGDLAYTTTKFSRDGTALGSSLVITAKNGTKVTANLLKYEKKHNPDGGVTYGIDHPTACQTKAFKPLGGATYKGLIDSHPYAVTAVGDSWVVAEAAGNDLLTVDAKGHVSTLAVLPRQPVKITKGQAKALELPKCVVGAVYNFEPVPTDVEFDGHRLVVSLLPGGPEDPSLGARGAVYAVDPWCGVATKLAGGFLGATNVALADDGRIFVAQLFGDKISVIDHGTVKTYAKLASPLSLVWHGGVLYAGTLAPTDEEGNPKGAGSLVAIS